MSAKTIIILLLTVVVVMAGTNIYSLWYITRLTDDLLQTTRITIPSVYHASDMNTNVSDYRIREWRHYIAQHPDSIRKEEWAAEEEMNRAMVHLAELRSLIPPTAPENTLRFKAELLFTRYLQQSSVFFSLSRTTVTKDEALNMMYGELRKEYDNLSETLAALVQSTAATAQERLAWYEQTIRTTRLILLAVVLGAALVSISAVSFLVHSLHRRPTNLQEQRPDA